MSEDIIATARSMLHHADDILTGPTGAKIWHVIERLVEQVERLARVLAVERGDWREVPPDWEPRGADMWVRGTHPGRPVIQRWHRDGQPTEWLRRGQIDGPRWPTALEAMEAIDAMVSDG